MNRPRAIALSLALLTFLVYLPCGWHEFIVFDDGDYVAHNGVVQAGLTWGGAKWAFQAWHFCNWHPLTWLSHMVDCQLFGLNPGMHHMVNVLFHAANAVLLLSLLLRMTKELAPSAIVAALFALHPLHVESVAWVAERKDVLSVFFGLWALIFYVRYADKKKLSSGATVDYWLAFVFFACALMSKPMLVTLPCVMLLLDYWPLGRVAGRRLQVAGSVTEGSQKNSEVQLRSLIREKLPFFLLAVASSVVTCLAQREDAMVSLNKFPLPLRIGNAVESYGGYLLKMIWPHNLAIIYPLPKQVSWLSVGIVAVLLLLTTGMMWRARQRRPFLLVGWLWFLGTLVPVIGLVQVGGAALADRYSYFPSIGIFLIAAFCGWEWAVKTVGRTKIFAIAASVVLGGCIVMTEIQLGYWRTSETLFKHALAVTTDNAAAHRNLGLALQQANRPQEAIVHYREALRIQPGQAGAHNNLATLLQDDGQIPDAVTEYREALRLNPNLARTHAKLGQLLAGSGKSDEAIQHFKEAIRQEPGFLPTYSLMGEELLAQGRDAEAVACFREAQARNPDDVPILSRLARVLAADEDPQVRNGREAVTLAEHVSHLTGDNTPYVLDVLAMAYAEAGRFDDAVSTIQKVIDIARSSGDTDAVAVLAARQKLYRDNKPYREKFSRNP